MRFAIPLPQLRAYLSELFEGKIVFLHSSYAIFDIEPRARESITQMFETVYCENCAPKFANPNSIFAIGLYKPLYLGIFY